VNRRCNYSPLECRARRTWTIRERGALPPFPTAPLATVEQHRIPRDKTKPGPRPPPTLASPSYAVAANGSSAPSGPGRLFRRTFNLTESTGTRPPLNSALLRPFSSYSLSLSRSAVPDRHLEQTPLASTTKRLGLRASWIFYLLAVLRISSSSPAWDRVLPSFPLFLHLVRFFFPAYAAYAGHCLREMFLLLHRSTTSLTSLDRAYPFYPSSSSIAQAWLFLSLIAGVYLG